MEIPGFASKYQEVSGDMRNCKEILGIDRKSWELLGTMSIYTSAVGTNPRDHISRRKALLKQWSLNSSNTEMCGKELLVNPCRDKELSNP